MKTEEKTEDKLVHGVFKVEGIIEGTLKTVCVTQTARLFGSISRRAAIPLLKRRISADYKAATVTFIFWCDDPVVRSSDPVGLARRGSLRQFLETRPSDE